MLKKAWYLITHIEFPAGARRLPQSPDLMLTLDDLFGTSPRISPEHTATAIEAMLRLAEHLSDSIPRGRQAVADDHQLAQLLHGANLLLSYMAQLGGRLAYQVDTGTGADLSALPELNRAALTTALAAAGCRLEEAAGLFKEAHLCTGYGLGSMLSRAMVMSPLVAAECLHLGPCHFMREFLVVRVRASRMRKDSPSVTTTVAWCRSRSSRLVAVTCSGRKRPHCSKGQCEAMPRARRS